MRSRAPLLILAALSLAANAAQKARDAADGLDELEEVQEPFPPDLKALPYPAGISMPWRLLQIDAADSSKTLAALKASATTLASSWLSSPQTLSAFVGQRHVVTLNNHLIADHIYTGAPQTPSSRPALTVEPSWCSVMDQHLFFVTVADTKLNTLLASTHVAIQRDAWDKMPPAQRTGYLNAQLPTLARKALEEAAKVAPRTNALHVGLSLTRSVTRTDEGAGLCLNQLLEQQLAPSYAVVRSVGDDHLALIRYLLSQPPAQQRATRSFILDWTHPPELQIDRHLPTKFTANAQAIDAVFGKHLPLTLTSKITCQAANAAVSCSTDGVLEKVLKDEAATLELADWPQVAKVYRAWTYLDRGRAWGLKMNDRVIAEVDGQQVKGHVVRFFGPEAKLVSPRGFPIREGAIIYIRLNQHLSRKGLTFKMDPRTFPTPYPLPAAK